MSPAEQGRVLLAMVLCGAALGAAYDVLLVLRRMTRSAALHASLDLLFGPVCAAGLIASALSLRIDALRWYVLAGAVMGMGLYMACVGTLVRSVMAGISRLRKKTAQRNGKRENDAG